MKAIALTLALAALALTACRDESPGWLAELQRQIQDEPVTNPPSQILRFDLDGRTVYYRPPYCCDVFGVLYANDGTVLCHPDGGITGAGDGRCPEFFARRQACARVWADPRGKRVPDACAAGSADPVR